MNKSVIVPGVLAVYLVVMAAIGYRQWAAGAYSSGCYFGLIALTSACIVLLHILMKRREKRQNK